VISVAATDSNDCKADFSTYGTWVDISAPGTGIYSLYHDHADAANDYVAAMDGTSMATPIAASVAALIWSQNPGWTATQVRDRLFTTADPINGLACNSSYAGKLGAGRVNAYNAVYGGGAQPPVAAFVGNPTSGVAPLTVQFTDQSSGSPTGWSWAFGDGGTSTAQNPSHVYQNAGTYTVTLTATNAYGSDQEVKTNYITATTCTAPVAAFVGNPTSGYAPLTVQFTDQSTGGPTSWSWAFGDGGTATTQSPAHAYANAGTYTVTLTATNSCGSDQEVKTSYITVSTPPAQQCDDFADGNISNWVNKTGTWTATGGYMKGNSTTLAARTTSPFGSYGVCTIDCDVRMNTGQNQRKARVIFAYIDGNNYRFVEGDDVNNRWRLYERVGGKDTSRRSVSRTISSGTWYHVTVTQASDGTVAVAVGGVSLGSYKFASAVTGLVGCGYNRSNSDFDNFCVKSTVSAVSDTPKDLVIAQAAGPAPVELRQNYPDPFTGSTTIAFSLAEAARVRLEIYNVAGQRVATLLDGVVEPGQHQVPWNARSDQGAALVSGVYFYRICINDTANLTRKMVLMQ